MWIRYPVWLFWALGFLAALPVVLDFAGALWWISLPILAAISVWYWFWGMKVVIGPEMATASVAEKSAALMIGLVQLFIGVVFAVFIVTFLVKNWPALVLTLMLLVVVFVFVGADSKPKRSKVVSATPEKPQDLVPEPSHEAQTAQQWVASHLSVLFLLGFGAAAAVAMAMKRPDIASPLELATVCAYAVVTWIHIVGRGEPGKKPYSLLGRIGMTFMGVMLTFVFIVVAIVAVQAAVEFWRWVVPVIGGLGLLFALGLLWDRHEQKKDATAEAAAAATPKRAPRKRFRERRDEVIR